MKKAFVSHVRPVIDFASVVWSTGYLGDMRLLESVQRSWTKKIDGLGDVPYGDRLLHLDLFSVKGRLLRADLIMTWKILNGLCPELSHLFVRNQSHTRGHDFKLFVPRCTTDIRARYFSLRVVPVWNSLPNEVVCASSVLQFKRLLGKLSGQILFEYV